MYKSYYKKGFTPAKTNRYAAAKARIQSNIANRRAISIPRTIVLKSNGEKKGMDTNLYIASVTNTSNTNTNCFVVNLIQQGSGSWNRVGRKVNLKSLRIKGSFEVTYRAHEQTLGNFIRMVVVWDKQPSSGSVPTFDQIFGTKDQDGTETSGILAPPKYDNMGRFRVLKDITFDCKPEANFWIVGGNDEVISYPISFDEYIKLNNLETVFSGQSIPMSISDISTGGLYIFFRALANQPGISQISVSSLSNARLRYTDI